MITRYPLIFQYPSIRHHTNAVTNLLRNFSGNCLPKKKCCHIVTFNLSHIFASIYTCQVNSFMYDIRNITRYAWHCWITIAWLVIMLYYWIFVAGIRYFTVLWQCWCRLETGLICSLYFKFILRSIFHQSVSLKSLCRNNATRIFVWLSVQSLTNTLPLFTWYLRMV